MNKQQYTDQLRALLEAEQVPDVEDILAEYEQHFLMKLSDGFSEEEIAARLESPAAIAEQYAAQQQSESVRTVKRKPLLGPAMALLDVFAAISGLLLWICVPVLGALAAGSVTLGACMAAGYTFSFAPMPRYGSLLFGLIFTAMGVLSGAGTVYCVIYFRSLCRKYLRWHKRVLHGALAEPSLPVRAAVGGRAGRRLRAVITVSLIAFLALFILYFVLMFAYTDFKPFWHALGWFGYQG